MAQKLYILGGPNGAGKTTASYHVLPELWDCNEFVNADEIARGISPFNPEEVAIEAGRLQLLRIDRLLDERKTFSIETTLATRSYVGLVRRAHAMGYEVELVFFYLPSAEDAIERVKLRVLSGGHNIPEPVIRRRFDLGLRNLFQLYMPIVDKWQLIGNDVSPQRPIAYKTEVFEVLDYELFESLRKSYGSGD